MVNTDRRYPDISNLARQAVCTVGKEICNSARLPVCKVGDYIQNPASLFPGPYWYSRQNSINQPAVIVVVMTDKNGVKLCISVCKPLNFDGVTEFPESSSFTMNPM